MKNFELLRQLSDNKNEIKDFVEDTNKILLEEEITAKRTLINQLLGHYNQILVRGQDTITKEELTRNTNIIKELTDKKNTIENESDINRKAESFNLIYDTLIKSYKELSNIIYNSNKLEKDITEYNNLVVKANGNITKLNTLDIPKSNEEELFVLYNSINKENIKALENFIIRTNELIKAFSFNPDKSKKNYKESVFNLFAKINDQIVGSSFINKDNLIYALYTLEDNSKYYAIVKNESEIKIIDQSFTTLPNLMLTKDNIINTCKIIIKNASIYYDLNEFMRYIEMSYKTKMTKEIDDLIASYKTRLTYLEENIKVQLGFIDSIALLVNHLPCDKYPNITYNDVSINEYFPNYNEENDSKLKEIERLIIEVLLNPNIKSEFNTKSILKTLYDTNTLSSLISSNYVKEDNTPIVNTSDNISNELEVTGNIKTNYDKIKDYLNMRVEELKLLESSPKINVTITKDDNNIFKDINTVLDLNIAVVICDKVYKKGQGIYAILDYLKTGNTLKFTSKYKARDLVNNVNKDEYLKLLLENIIKRYIYEKYNNIKSNVVILLSPLLEKDNITIKEVVFQILNNDNILEDAVINYSYEFLDSLSNKSKEVNILLENNNLINISNILQNIKKNNELFNEEIKYE